MKKNAKFPLVPLFVRLKMAFSSGFAASFGRYRFFTR